MRLGDLPVLKRQGERNLFPGLAAVVGFDNQAVLADRHPALGIGEIHVIDGPLNAAVQLGEGLTGVGNVKNHAPVARPPRRSARRGTNTP